MSPHLVSRATYHIVLRLPPCVSSLNLSVPIEYSISIVMTPVDFLGGGMLTGAMVEYVEVEVDASLGLVEDGEIGDSDVGRGGKPSTASSTNKLCSGKGGGS